MQLSAKGKIYTDAKVSIQMINSFIRLAFNIREMVRNINENFQETNSKVSSITKASDSAYE